MKKTISKIALWMFSMLALSGSAMAANLLSNPQFAPVSGSTDYHVYGLVAPPSWSNIGTSNGPLPNDIYSSVGRTPYPMPSYIGSSYFYDLGGYGNPDPNPGDGISQSFNTIPGHKYTLTFGHNSEADGLSQDQLNAGFTETGSDSLMVVVGDQSRVFSSPYQAGSFGYGIANTGTSGGALRGAWQMPWVERSVVFVASSTSTTVVFKVNSVSTNNYPSVGVSWRNGANSQVIAMPLVEEVPPTLTVVKELLGTGRISNSDQFTVSILKGGVVQNDTTHSTTQGSGSTVTAGSGTTGVFTAVADADYTLDEAMAAGSVSTVSQYSAKVVCTNALSGGTDVSGIKTLGAHIMLKGSDVVTCKIQNEPGIRLTIHKLSKGGIGSFIFKGTANGNGFTTDNSYTINTITAGVVADGTTVSLTSPNTLTEIQEVMPAGWIMNNANCVDSNATNPGATFGLVINGSTLQIPAANVVLGANLNCTFTNTSTGFSVSGKIILDTGVGSGTPHDAVQNGAETGHSGVPLNLTDCGTTVYSTSTSGADGSFSLSLNGVPAGQPVCVVELLPGTFNPVSVNPGTTGGTYNASASTLRFTPAANTSYSGVVLGEAPKSTFTNDGAQQTSAGQSVSYAHVYIAGSAGSVTFSSTNSPTPAGLLWNSVLYLDANCNGTLESPDSIITGPIDVLAGQEVCIIDRVSSPAGPVEGAKDVTTVTAKETWTVPTLSPTSQDHFLRNNDTTTVSVAGLTLLKEVRKLSSCPADAASSIDNLTPYATNGSAKPGDFLEYRLRYGNNTAAPITGIKVNDVVPVYTQFVRALCLTLPTTGISGCAPTIQPASGATDGPILWAVSDAVTPPVGLQPLGFGTVSFCVQVQQ